MKHLTVREAIERLTLQDCLIYLQDSTADAQRDDSNEDDLLPSFEVYNAREDAKEMMEALYGRIKE